MADSRSQILKAVTKPLQFQALALLVTEAVLVALVVKLPAQFTGWLIAAIVGFLLIFICYGVYIEIQDRKIGTWLSPYASLFAVDLIDGLAGYLTNLTPTEQREAWASLVDVLLKFDDQRAPRAYVKFRVEVAEDLKRRKVDEKKLLGRTQGPIG